MFAIAVSVALAAVPAAAAPAGAAVGPGTHPDPVHVTRQASAQHKRPATLVAVTNRHDAGPGSLRAALQTANAGPRSRLTVIFFKVRGVIKLASPLPVVARRVIIDGNPVAGRPAEGRLARPRAGSPPVVEIDCNRHRGLVFAGSSAHSALFGVAVDNAAGAGVRLSASFITLAGDYVGLNLAGKAFGNRGDGVYVARTSSHDVIGKNLSGASGVVSNVISGNRGSGIVLDGSAGDTVAANRIGTNPAGTGAIPNGRDGLRIVRGAHGNEIGGTEFVDSATGQANNPTGSKGTETPVFVVPPLGNLISGNAGNGVLIASGSARNSLNGNFIGTTADGDGGLGNGGNGVWIRHASRDSLVGCKFVNNPFVYYNVVSANRLDGLRITDSNEITVQGNFFGVGANNTAMIGNGRNGILVDGTSRDTQVGGVIPLGNVSSANRWNGIAVTGKVRGFVTFNTFGGLLAFKGAAPNGRDGLLITSTGGDNLARTNVFSGNRRNGIELAGNARGVTVDPDIVGLNTKGNGALPNGGDGLLIGGNAHGNTVGGQLRSVIPQNTLSANGGYGLAITGTAHHNRVLRTFIGTKILGAEAAPNGRGGVLLGGGAYDNSIGVTLLRPKANIISGNKGVGVTLLAGTHHNRVIGNLIGVSRTGRRLPNSRGALLNLGHRNLIIGNRF